jgi:hypothetical protein
MKFAEKPRARKSTISKADICAGRSERPLRADSVEKQRIAEAESGVGMITRAPF